MRLAIPEFNGRVSPVFDFSRQLLVVEVSEDGSDKVLNVDWSDANIRDRVDRLRELRVDTVLCGGISRELAGDIKRNGIRVVPWISGNIKEVLNAFFSQELPNPRFSMPGCPGRGGVKGGCSRSRDTRGMWYRGRRWR